MSTNLARLTHPRLSLSQVINEFDGRSRICYPKPIPFKHITIDLGMQVSEPRAKLDLIAINRDKTKRGLFTLYFYGQIISIDRKKP